MRKTFTTPPPPQDHALLARLTRRTELVTGLEISAHLAHDPYRTFAAEAWQMGLYGSGGHYLPHYDAFDTVSSFIQLYLLSRQEFNNGIVTCHVSSQVGTDGHAGGVWVGNRVATVMFYLSDLVGGFTVLYCTVLYCTVLYCTAGGAAVLQLRQPPQPQQEVR